MLRSLPWLGWLVAGTLVAAAGYELALALGAGSLGPEPGDGVAGSWVVNFLALLAMVAAAGLAAAFSAHPGRGAPLLAPSAAAYLVAFYFTYDPYYAPELYRYSEGNVGGAWIAIVAAIAAGAGVLTLLRPRVGAAVSGIVLLVVVATTVLAGDGH
jgi:hypothetical protein